MEERLDIDTPESVAFGYKVAGIGSRFLAALVDTAILTFLIVTFFCAFGALAEFISGLGLGNWLLAAAILFIFGLIWGYYIFFEMVWNGQSPGKRWLGLRVIQTQGTPITLVDSLIRNLIRVIDFMPLYYTVGLVTMFLNAQARRLGDLAAGTLVVKEPGDVTLESVQQTLRVGTSLPDASHTHNLSASDVRLITDFLSRRNTLRNRGTLARRIAAAMATKLDLPRPASTREAEELLIRLARQPHRE